MLKLGISQRLLFVLFATALLPYMSISLFWYASSLSKLHDTAAQQQAARSTRISDQVNLYLSDKVHSLATLAQMPGIVGLTAPGAASSLMSLLAQNKDITQVILTTVTGKEITAISQSGQQPLSDLHDDSAVQMTKYLGGKEYISPVSFDDKKQPLLTIATPILAAYTNSPATIRPSEDIKGVLLTTVNLSNLFSTTLNPEQTSAAYSYIVDSRGRLIDAPASSGYSKPGQDLTHAQPVAAFLARNAGTASAQVLQNPRGYTVLSSYATIPHSGWGIITEQPVNAIYGATNHAAIVGSWLFIIICIATLVLTYLFSRHLIIPIRTLVSGARQLSQGDLSTRIPVSPDDEVGVLGTAFNAMADTLESNIKETRAQASKVNVILNNVGEGIIAVDGQGKIMLVNIAATIFIGAVPKDIIGKQLIDVYQWQQKGKPLELNLHEIHVYEEVTLTNADRRERFVDLLVNPIANDPSGIKVIVTIIDKTNERDLENMKIDFVSMAAHELRTPMTAIRGYLDLIWHDRMPQLPDQTQNYLQHIQSSSTQLVGLINNLLNVSRIERGSLTLKKGKLDWAKVVQSSISDQQFLAHTKSITLRYIGPNDSIFIFADQLAITEVINNLISNAIHYTLEGGHVTVSLKEENGKVFTSVADDGIGIKPEGLEHLFTRFYRVHDELTTGIGGTGLGLYISKSMVELHKGSIEVKSQVGEGSTFTVILPSFNEVEYNEMVNSSPLTLNSKHGWFTKNTARRR